MLEAHIMQAQAAAMAADERELQRISEGYENYQSLGLPPGKVHGLFVVFINFLIIYLHDIVIFLKILQETVTQF